MSNTPGLLRSDPNYFCFYLNSSVTCLESFKVNAYTLLRCRRKSDGPCQYGKHPRAATPIQVQVHNWNQTLMLYLLPLVFSLCLCNTWPVYKLCWGLDKGEEFAGFVFI